MSKLNDAIMLACDAHRGQVDKGGASYILHPLRVMLAVTGEAQQITAVLHDTVEDCGIAPAMIRQRFGEDIADAVEALTRRDGESYPDFILRCRHNAIATAVKRADIADNMDLSRIPEPSADDHARLEKYRAALVALAGG